MRTCLMVILGVLGFSPLWAVEREPVPVNENAFLIQKEIAVWPTDQTFNSQVPVYNCQAVRLHENWFLTSAHCVYSACAARPCTVEITLAESPDLLARVRVKHSTVSPSVYIYRGFFPGQNRISGMDAALIRFVPQKAEFSYVNLEDGTPLSPEEFENAFASSSGTEAGLRSEYFSVDPEGRRCCVSPIIRDGVQLGIIVVYARDGALSREELHSLSVRLSKSSRWKKKKSLSFFERSGMTPFTIR